VKIEHALYAIAGLLGARFYEHLSFGRGIQALIVVIRFGEAF